MKELTKMSRAIAMLEKIYRDTNSDLWSNSLPMPIITVQSKPGTYGHMSVKKIWVNANDAQYELNIAAEVLLEPIEEILDTIIHEQVHLYCRENNIKETTKGSGYHNNKFKEIAESHLLYCYKTEKYGWNTKGKENDKLTEYAINHDYNEFRFARAGTMGLSAEQLISMLQGGRSTIESAPTTQGRKPSSTRKLICPKCKTSVRATRDVFILCGNCMERMVTE